jgi:Tol biopolymer transport system component
MKNILLIISIIVLLSNVNYSQSKTPPSIVFKPIQFIRIEDSVSENILEVESFREAYHERTNSAHIEYITWSSNSDYIAFTVSQIYTGDCDDIWVVSTRDKKINHITSIFPRDNQLVFYTPVWRNADTLIFSMPNFNVIYDVGSDKLVSKVRANEQSRPSHYSPDGKLRIQYEDAGSAVTVYTKDGEEGITIGEGEMKTGSILGQAFSSDSRFLAVEQFMGHGDSRIVIADIELDSMYIMRLSFKILSNTYGLSNWFPGKNIFHVSDNQGNLHFLDVVKHSDRTLNVPGYYIVGAAWSPDGNRLALILQKRGGTYSIHIIKNPISN